MSIKRFEPVSVFHDEGYWSKYEFENGYDAYVASNPRSYGGKEGLFEVGVLRCGEVVCTPITGDVLGYVEFGEVEGILDAIAELPKYCVEENSNEN